MTKAIVTTSKKTSYSLDNIISVTFSRGQIYIIYKDQDGGLSSASYSRDSLEEGSVVIS